MCDPRFVDASEVSLLDGHHVMGLSLNGEARAYQVGILNRREMINDVVGGVPVLVTWYRFVAPVWCKTGG